MNSLVSVVIPYYNNEKTIIRAIESVRNQLYKNLELTLIDDGSSDNSYSLVENYLLTNKLEFDVRHIKQKNSGPSIARNKGILLAKGKYVAFLDADDSWEKEKVKVQMDILDKHPNIDMLGCNFYINDLTNNKKNRHYFVKEPLRKITFNDMLYKHFYATPCVIVKKDVIIDCGMFNNKQKYMEDSLLFTKIVRKYNAYMSNDFLVNTYKNSFGESGLSGNLNCMQKFELINFKTLYKENNNSNNKMSLTTFVFCNLFSILKFVRRKILVILRK